MSTVTFKSGVIEVLLNPRNSTDGTGPISAPGLKVGDRLIALRFSSGVNIAYALDQYEGVVSVADEIQQVDFATSTPNQVLTFLRFG